MADKKDKVQIVEPLVLFDNLAQGFFSLEDKELQDWANQHGFSVSAVADDNRKHLEDAIKAARLKLPVQDTTDTLPASVITQQDADQVFAVLGSDYRLAGRNSSNQSGSDKIRHARQMLKLHKQQKEA